MERRDAYVREAGAGVPLVCIHASASSSSQWRPLMDRLAGRFRVLAVDLWRAAFEEPVPLSAFGALDVPTLCLVGSDSPASSRAVARLLAKTLPRVTEIEIDGVGHMGPVTHPDRINARIEGHLEQLTSGA